MKKLALILISLFLVSPNIKGMENTPTYEGYILSTKIEELTEFLDSCSSKDQIDPDISEELIEVIQAFDNSSEKSSLESLFSKLVYTLIDNQLVDYLQIYLDNNGFIDIKPVSAINHLLSKLNTTSEFCLHKRKMALQEGRLLFEMLKTVIWHINNFHPRLYEEFENDTPFITLLNWNSLQEYEFYDEPVRFLLLLQANPQNTRYDNFYDSNCSILDYLKEFGEKNNKYLTMLQNPDKYISESLEEFDSHREWFLKLYRNKFNQPEKNIFYILDNREKNLPPSLDNTPLIESSLNTPKRQLQDENEDSPNTKRSRKEEI